MNSLALVYVVGLAVSAGAIYATDIVFRAMSEDLDKRDRRDLGAMAFICSFWPVAVCILAVALLCILCNHTYGRLKSCEERFHRRVAGYVHKRFIRKPERSIGYRDSAKQ